MIVKLSSSAPQKENKEQNEKNEKNAQKAYLPACEGAEEGAASSAKLFALSVLRVQNPPPQLSPLTAPAPAPIQLTSPISSPNPPSTRPRTHDPPTHPPIQQQRARDGRPRASEQVVSRITKSRRSIIATASGSSETRRAGGSNLGSLVAVLCRCTRGW